MNIVFAVFVGWAMLLMSLTFGRASFILYDRLNGTGLSGDGEVENEEPTRVDLLRRLVKEATEREEVDSLYNYGCWCGRRGHGKYVDNFDFCCKPHDFCEIELSDDDKCGGNLDNMLKGFKYDETTKQCTPVSEYLTGDVEEKKCAYAVCICDMEMVRCMGHYKNEINPSHISYQQCAITAGDFCKTKADVVVLIQDSSGISTTTVESIKTVVRRLLTLLGSESTDFKFALATYAKSRQMSCFGTASATTSYMDREYIHGRRGNKNLLKRALSRMILKQFQKRRDDRKGDDTGKILVIFSDGNAEHGRSRGGQVMDTFRLEKTAKQLRVGNKIKIVGALIPNTQNTQRIQELKSIVSEPNDAIDEDFSASNLNNIADLLAARVKRLVACRVKYTIEVYTPTGNVHNEYNLKVRIKGQRDKETEDQALTEPTTEMQGNLHVIKAEFLDLDVGTIRRVCISPSRKVQGDSGWRLQEIKVKKGDDQPVTAEFNRDIPTWPLGQWYSARATASNPPTES